jgi:hypothetical protein
MPMVGSPSTPPTGTVHLDICPGQGPEVLRRCVYEAGKTYAPDHAYYAQVQERRRGHTPTTTPSAQPPGLCQSSASRHHGA